MIEHLTSDYPPITLSARVLLKAEVWALAAIYWPYDEVENAVNIAQLESGFATAAWNNRDEDSRGLWQVNIAPGAHPDLKHENLFDPQVNAYYAAAIWRHSGWAAWYNSATQLGLL
jgi:hypothetical protein